MMPRKPKAPPAPFVVPDTPEAAAAIAEMFEERRMQSQQYFQGVRNALPMMGLPPELAAEFDQAAQSLQARFSQPMAPPNSDDQ